MPIFYRVPEPEEHACLPMTETEAMDYILKLSCHTSNKQPNKSTSLTRKASEFGSDIFRKGTKIRVVEDSDVLPFLIREPHNPSLVRRFVGSNTGLLCQFCNENKNQVVGRFSDVGKLVITGTHLPACRPFNLEENSKSIGCQTSELLNRGPDFKIDRNILKVHDREYIASGDDGQVFHCKLCLKLKKTVVEAKLRTVVMEEKHCLECEKIRKKENEENCSPEPETGAVSSSEGLIKTTLSPEVNPRGFSAFSRNSKINIPRNSYKFDFAGSKKYILLQNPSNPKESWEFMEHIKQSSGMVNYKCLSCGSYYLKLNTTQNELYYTPRIHNCKTTLTKLLKEKYRDLRAGIRIDRFWWKMKYEEYNVPVVRRRLKGKFGNTNLDSSNFI
ncbi:hypothetical protein FO519_008676 [Halicephalobus sp. NKZ332]|nr:hypothetical protein FO519_008676 [Halicephalobus sp. NKZ332]